MSQLFSARQICVAALRKIGAMSINDSAADGEELAEALMWLDLEMAELAGTQRCFWLVPDTLSVPLTGAVGSYDLDGTLGADTPSDGIQFPIAASVKTGTNAEIPIRIVHRLEYEAIPAKDQSGQPELIYIDRLRDLKLYTWPVLGAGVTGVSIELVVQTFAPSFKGNGQMATGLRASWQKWAINTVGASIGDGSVRRLPRNEVKDMRDAAKESLAMLDAFENREHTSRPRVTAYYDGV